MSYTTKNFKTKKAIKEAIANGEKITCYNPGLGGELPKDGVVYIEGPHYPQPHRFYGKGTLKDGYLIKIT